MVRRKEKGWFDKLLDWSDGTNNERSYNYSRTYEIKIPKEELIEILEIEGKVIFIKYEHTKKELIIKVEE